MIDHSHPKRLVVVGNGPVARDLSGHVDTADFVIRFNEPKASRGMTGTRTDLLFVCNTGKPMRLRLQNPHYLDLPTVRAARQVVLPYHPVVIARYFEQPNLLSRLRGKRTDLTMPTVDRLGRAGKTVSILPPQFYEDGCHELGLHGARMKSVFPSTGYFGIRYAILHFDPARWKLEICGFSWQGWASHAWADERRWVRERMGNPLSMVE